MVFFSYAGSRVGGRTPARRRTARVADTSPDSSATAVDTEEEEEDLLSPAESLGTLRRQARAEGIPATGTDLLNRVIGGIGSFFYLV